MRLSLGTLVLLLVLSSPCLAGYTCTRCNGLGKIVTEDVVVEEYETTPIMPGDKNWMRGFDYYVHKYKGSRTRTIQHGHYATCPRCGGTGLDGDWDRTESGPSYRVGYQPAGEGMLKKFHHYSSKTLIGLVDGDKKEILPAVYDRMENFNQGLLIFKRNSDSSHGMVDRNGRILIPIGKYNRINIWEGGMGEAIALHKPSIFFIYDGENYFQSTRVWKYQYHPDAKKTYTYWKMEFDINGKKLYGLSQSGKEENPIFPPVYESLELKGENPSNGVFVTMHGKTMLLKPGDKEPTFYPLDYEVEKKGTAHCYIIKDKGKYGLYNYKTGELLVAPEYGTITRVRDKEILVQGICHRTVMKGKEVFFDGQGNIVTPQTAEILQEENYGDSAVILARIGDRFRLMTQDNRQEPFREIQGMGEIEAVDSFFLDANSSDTVLINRSGDQIVFGLYSMYLDDFEIAPTHCDAINTDYLESQECFTYKKEGTWGLVHLSGKRRAPLGIYEELRIVDYEDVFVAAIDGKFCFFRGNGEKFTFCEFDDLVPYYGPYVLATVDEKQGLLEVGKRLVPIEFDEILVGQVQPKIVPVREGDEWGIYNVEKKKVQDKGKFDEVSFGGEDLWLVKKKKDKYAFQSTLYPDFSTGYKYDSFRFEGTELYAMKKDETYLMDTGRKKEVRLKD